MLVLYPSNRQAGHSPSISRLKLLSGRLSEVPQSPGSGGRRLENGGAPGAVCGAHRGCERAQGRVPRHRSVFEFFPGRGPQTGVRGPAEREEPLASQVAVPHPPGIRLPCEQDPAEASIARELLHRLHCAGAKGVGELRPLRSDPPEGVEDRVEHCGADNGGHGLRKAVEGVIGQRVGNAVESSGEAALQGRGGGERKGEKVRAGVPSQ